MAASAVSVLTPDDLNDTDDAVLDVLNEGRVTPQYAADQMGVSRTYASERLKRLVEHAHVEKVAPGLYELVDDPRFKPVTIRFPDLDEENGFIEASYINASADILTTANGTEPMVTRVYHGSASENRFTEDGRRTIENIQQDGELTARVCVRFREEYHVEVGEIRWKRKNRDGDWMVSEIELGSEVNNECD